MTERPSTGSGTAVHLALKQLVPWQRNVLFLLGAVAFARPLIDHYVNNVIRGIVEEVTFFHVVNDATFLFAGVLGMIPPLAMRIGDKLLSWKKK